MDSTLKVVPSHVYLDKKLQNKLVHSSHVGAYPHTLDVLNNLACLCTTLSAAPRPGPIGNSSLLIPTIKATHFDTFRL